MSWIHSVSNPSLPVTYLIVSLSVALGGCSHRVVAVGVSEDPQKVEVPALDDVEDEVATDQALPTFDPARVRPETYNDKSVNLSSAVTRLDLEPLRRDRDDELSKIHPSFRDAVESVKSAGVPVLASVDLINAKSRPFEAGMIAALEEHWFHGGAEGMPGDLSFLRRLAATLPVDCRAAAYFAVGLELAGVEIPATNVAARDYFAKRYSTETAQRESTHFGLWNERTDACYRVNRFFQMEFDLDDFDWMQPLLQSLRSDASLAEDYRRILSRWQRVANATSRLTMMDLVDSRGAVELVRLKRDRKITSSAVSLFPPRSHRELELARRLFPLGYSAEEDIWNAMVAAIRQERLDLRPQQKSGWFDYQVYALETLLNPQRGDEACSLSLSGRYLRRRMEVPWERTTFSEITPSGDKNSGASSERELQTGHSLFSPRLRLEPAPTFYVRMARSYRFLDGALSDLIAEPQLSQLYGLTAGGKRNSPLIQELRQLRRLFYGCYALSIEDLGMKLELDETELTELEESRSVAQEWLGRLIDDPDLAMDARIVIPIVSDSRRDVTSALAVLGVRVCRLEASYRDDAVPRVRDSNSGEEWTPLEPFQLGESSYLLPVDDLNSVKIPRSHVPTHVEFQKLCDELVEREKVLTRLQL